MRAIQHDRILNLPHLGLVLMPGVETPVTAAQAEELAAHGVTLLPDEPKSTPAPTPIPFRMPPTPALDEEHNR